MPDFLFVAQQSALDFVNTQIVEDGKRRRWCSMEVCGNRTRVQPHRVRARAVG